MNLLGFVFNASQESNDHEVRPLISGADLLDSIGAGDLGLDPPEFFKQSGLLKGGEILIGRCSCGVIGCGDQQAMVEITGDEFIWLLAGGRRIEFDRTQYETALAQNASDTAWESLERTAERLVGSLDFSGRAERGYVFQWASARIKKGQITLSFIHGRGHQVTIDIGWDHKSPEDARNRVLGWMAADA